MMPSVLRRIWAENSRRHREALGHHNAALHYHQHGEKPRRNIPVLIDRTEAERLRAHLEYYLQGHEPAPKEIEADQLKQRIGDARITELFFSLISVAPTHEIRQRLESLAIEMTRVSLEEELIGIEARC